ncbi:hypothetical protein SDC9_23941 [bioreactor metagenome]|uniref:Uncharacterized protein n=1 Tax=bioreactor metagenome TaxID=1076179 RepID=A0A644UGT2_9ZZZZ|nr:hypothetical protein [Methanobrevibacter sp.]MEA4957188.1 hypothetical protein [Methanobrevibacter sp.]
MVEDKEKIKLQNLVKSCLLEINELKIDLMNLENEKNLLKNDDTAEKLKNTLKEKEDLISNLKVDLNNLQVSLNNKENIINNQELKIQDLSDFKDSFNDIKIALENDLKKFKTQELKEYSDKLESSLDTIVKKDERINSLLNDINSYKEKINDLESDILSKDNLIGLQREIDSKDNEIKILKSASVDQEVFKSIKKELEDKKIRINELEEIQKSFEEIKYSYEEKLSDKDNRIEELEKIKLSFNDIKNSLENDIEQYKIKELGEINANLKSALNKIVEKDNKIKSLVNELNEKKLEIRKIKDQNVSKAEYDRVKDEINIKDLKIQRLEEIKGLFSDLDKNFTNKSQESLDKNNDLDSEILISEKSFEKSDELKNIQDSEDNIINNNNNNELINLKKELDSCKQANKELLSIRNNYKKITSSPKSDLTSFQSQIYYLIPENPMDSQEIHSYIRKIAFKDISYNNINNIIRGLERKGYLKPEDPENPQESKWIKIDKK